MRVKGRDDRSGVMLLCDSCGVNEATAICCGGYWCEKCWKDHDIVVHDFPIVPEEDE